MITSQYQEEGGGEWYYDHEIYEQPIMSFEQRMNIDAKYLTPVAKLSVAMIKINKGIII